MGIWPLSQWYTHTKTNFPRVTVRLTGVKSKIIQNKPFNSLFQTLTFLTESNGHRKKILTFWFSPSKQQQRPHGTGPWQNHLPMATAMSLIQMAAYETASRLSWIVASASTRALLCVFSGMHWRSSVYSDHRQHLESSTFSFSKLVSMTSRVTCYQRDSKQLIIKLEPWGSINVSRQDGEMRIKIIILQTCENRHGIINRIRSRPKAAMAICAGN